MQNLFLHLEGITEEWNEWMKSPPGTPPRQLTRMQVTLQAQAPAILCYRLNKHPKHTIYRQKSSQLPSMVGFFRVLSSLSVLRPNHREQCCARSQATSSLLRGLQASTLWTRLISGGKCGPSTRWKLSQSRTRETTRGGEQPIEALG